MDTFAWIEYFAGSEKGERAKGHIDSGEAITPTIVIAEFTDKYTIVALDDEIAEVAGIISAERRAKVKGWGLVDSVVLATARVRGVKVVTGDEHFKDLNEAIMIGEQTN